MIKKFWIFLKNVWYFRKELWEYRDWDWEYCMAFLRRSLMPLRDTLENGYTKSGKDDAKSIQRFLDATDEKEFWDMCPKMKDHYDGLKEVSWQERKRLFYEEALWEEARWKRAMTELNKMREWWG